MWAPRKAPEENLPHGGRQHHRERDHIAGIAMVIPTTKARIVTLSESSPTWLPLPGRDASVAHP